jgi:hypothetical protein
MPAGSAVPWAPEDLPIAADDLGSWNYVVLEEIVDDIALLRRWPWPVVDPLGRLLWADGAEHDTDDASADVDLLRVQIYAANGIERKPRCGDTFAAPPSVDLHWRETHTHDLRELLGSADVYDISADAREAAKIAYQSSLGAIQPAHAADDEAHALALLGAPDPPDAAPIARHRYSNRSTQRRRAHLCASDRKRRASEHTSYRARATSALDRVLTAEQFAGLLWADVAVRTDRSRLAIVLLDLPFSSLVLRRQIVVPAD